MGSGKWKPQSGKHWTPMEIRQIILFALTHFLENKITREQFVPAISWERYQNWIPGRNWTPVSNMLLHKQIPLRYIKSLLRRDKLSNLNFYFYFLTETSFLTLSRKLQQHWDNRGVT